MKYVVTILLLTSSFIWSCNEDVTSKAYDVSFDENLREWIVYHPETNAMWLRCDVGQTWHPDKKVCEGDVAEVTLLESVDACPDGFTLPSNADFATILCNFSRNLPPCNGNSGYDSCENCTICHLMFPEVGNESYSASYYSSDFYWIEETERYNCFNFDLWGEASCIYDYTVDGSREKKSVKCIRQSDSVVDEQ